MTSPQQRFYLDALGIQVWQRRDLPVESEASVENAAVETPPTHPVEPSPPKPVAEVQAPVLNQPSPQPFDDGIPDYLDDAPPIESFMPERDESTFDDAGMPAESEVPVAVDVANLDWAALQQRVGECTNCPELVANRSRTVFGVGNQQADWMIIGEAPGADEDEQGEPFVGKAGQLLNAMLQALGLKRQQVYIANILKCRPPNNRDPLPEEAAACDAFLKRQIALIQPKVILVVGRIAAQNLLKVDTPIGKMRGTVYQYEGSIPVVVTYHPAYLLRSPQEKRKSWADLCLAKSVIESER